MASLRRADADAGPADGSNVGASAAESAAVRGSGAMHPLSAELAAPAGRRYLAATPATGPAWKPLHSRAEFARPRSAGESWPEGLPEESGDSDGGVPAASAVAGAHFKGRRGPSGCTGSAPR